jgi:hypothetical protein
MSYWDFLIAFSRFLARGDSVHRVKDIGRIIPISTRVTDANRDTFYDHKPVLVLECLTINKAWLNHSVAVFATISVHALFLKLGDFVDRNNQIALVQVISRAAPILPSARRSMLKPLLIGGIVGAMMAIFLAFVLEYGHRKRESGKLATIIAAWQEEVERFRRISMRLRGARG